MSMHRLLKSIFCSGKYEAEKRRCEYWKQSEERRIINSNCTNQLTQMLFANNSFPATITIASSFIMYTDGIAGHNPTYIHYGDLGFPPLNRFLKEYFVIYPSDYSWQDTGYCETVDQLLFLTHALHNRPEAKGMYHVVTKSDEDGHIYSYNLVRKDYNPQSW